MKDARPDSAYKKGAWSLIKIWLLVFLFIGLSVTIVQLWGTGVPIKQYPIIFLKAVLSIPMLILFFCVAILPIGWSLWWRRKKADRGNEEGPN